MENKQPLIKIEDVSVVYQPGKTSEVWGSKHVNLEIFQEEYVIFFGPSGSGKSTLLYVIAGLEKPTMGKVSINGRDLSGLNEKDLIEFHRNTTGIVFQAFYLIPNLSIQDNILLPQVFKGVPKKERMQRLNDLSERFEITRFLPKRSTEVSGGQQQRAAAARALANNPLLILADEPTGNLDSKNAETMMQLLSELNTKDKKTVVLVTHDPRYLPYAHKVFYMKDGEVVKMVRNEERYRTQSEQSQHQISELELLARDFPYLSEFEIGAKLVANQLVTPFSVEEQYEIETLVRKYLANEISEQELFNILDKPLKAGGLGLYAPRAERIVKRLLELKKEIELVKAEEEKHASGEQDEVLKLRRHLLDNYSGELEVQQVERLDVGVRSLLQGKIDVYAFRDYLSQKYNQGGVGLEMRTARNFMREIELVMIEKVK